MIRSNAGRYPVSAQCEILGVARATYYYSLSHERKEVADPLEEEVVSIFKENRGRYGARRIKAVLSRRGKCASRRRIAGILKKNNLWNYICLLIDLYNREIVGHAVGERKDARLVKSAFATLDFPISDIEVFHTDRGSEFDNAQIDEMLEVFEVRRSLSKKGCPYDNAVDESTNKTLKDEFVYQEEFASLHDLQLKLSDYVHWYNHKRLHSTLGYMSPVEFREAGLSL